MSELTIHEVLVAARNLISNPAWWCKGDYGHPAPGAPKCAVGAMEAVVGVSKRTEKHEAVFRETNAFDPKVAIEKWNDAPERTHTEVLAAFDRAIAATAPQPDTSFLSDVEEAIPA